MFLTGNVPKEEEEIQIVIEKKDAEKKEDAQIATTYD